VIDHQISNCMPRINNICYSYITIRDCALSGGWHKLWSVKMCDKIGRPESPSCYGLTISSKAAQHGYCWSIWWLHLLRQCH